MKNYDEQVKINHNANWYYIINHPYRIIVRKYLTRKGVMRAGKCVARAGRRYNSWNI